MNPTELPPCDDCARGEHFDVIDDYGDVRCACCGELCEE